MAEHVCLTAQKYKSIFICLLCMLEGDNRLNPFIVYRLLYPIISEDFCDMNASNSSEISNKRLLIDLNSGLAVIGCLAAISNVILILVTGAYRQYVHRLQLYLAIVSFVFAAALGFETLPVTVDTNGNVTVQGEGWNDACVAIGYIAQHFGFSKAYCIIWICIYVFILAIFRKQHLRQLRFEILGLVIVFALPAATAWVPLINRSYGLIGIWCWIKANSGEVTTIFQFGFSQGSEILLHTISIVLLSAVVIRLCRGVFFAQGHLQLPYRAALLEVAPLIIYPSIYSIANLVSATKSIFDAATHGKKPNDSNIEEMVVVCLLQTFLFALPLSFLMHPSVRRELADQCRSIAKKRSKQYGQAIGTSTTESQRHTQLSDHAATMIQTVDEDKPLLSSPSGFYGTRE